MSTRHICDYRDCEREATTRIVEEPYDHVTWSLPTKDGLTGRGLALDACDEHRTVTHPGWWCYNHEEVLRQQAAREASAS